jgi:hypothetical protein
MCVPIIYELRDKNLSGSHGKSTSFELWLRTCILKSPTSPVQLELYANAVIMQAL